MDPRGRRGEGWSPFIARASAGVGENCFTFLDISAASSPRLALLPASFLLRRFYLPEEVAIGELERH